MPDLPKDESLNCKKLAQIGLAKLGASLGTPEATPEAIFGLAGSPAKGRVPGRFWAIPGVVD
jgi:hypothetical protein